VSPKTFVDTNILVYAHDEGAGERHRAARALVERLWDDRSGVISTQVLQELVVNVRKKAARPVTTAEAAQLVRDYLAWEVVINDGAALLDALELEERFQLSFWDALIVQSAIASGARLLCTEDLSHGQRFRGVEVVDPFR